MRGFMFRAPCREILDRHDFAAFTKSESCRDVMAFVTNCADAVVGTKISDDFVVNEMIFKFQSFMELLYNLVDEIPPLQQPMRFGNKAFRTWHARLVRESSVFLEDLLPREMVEIGAIEELGPYLHTAFGNETRIDYGTGHELNIALFFMCLFKLHLISKDDLKAVVLRGFTSYIRCMRRLQEDYMLEPAGSHGVWGLDDYHCLTFVWGSAQLVDHPDILPSSIHQNDVLRDESSDYLYLEGITFIKKIKSSAPFHETSPMLNDISGVSDWKKVCSGLVRLFLGEVLGKQPVVQHVLFGSIFACTWKVTSGEKEVVPTNDSIASISVNSPSERIESGVSDSSTDCDRAVPSEDGLSAATTSSSTVGTHRTLSSVEATRAPWA